MKWENLREEEFEDAIKRSGGLCVMALGCLEKHAQHLPVGTDSLKGDKIVEMASERADVMMFPTTMWLGDVIGAKNMTDPAKYKKHGFIGMNPNTLLTVLEELCDEIARNGFNKIIICNSHGGNKGLLAYLMRAITYKKKNYALMWTGAYDTSKLEPRIILETARANPEEFPMLTEADYEVLEKFAKTGTGGGHADFRETSLVYGTHPDLVAPERFDAENGLSTHKGDYIIDAGINFNAAWGANFPNAYEGFCPTGCSKTIGDATVKIAVDRLAGIFELIKNDQKCLEMIGISEQTC